MVISNAPSRLRPNTRKIAAMKPLTHGFEPSCTMPNGPRIAVATRPRPENSTMMPRQKISACVTLSRRDPDGRFRKNDMVIGIIGNTQGVKIAARPKPNAVSRKSRKILRIAPASALAAGGGRAPRRRA